jgi:hypothetical protein
MGTLNSGATHNNPMVHNLNQLKKFNTVLAGKSTASTHAAVLPGIDELKYRLECPAVEVRIAALTEALNHGEAGFDLIIQALNDYSKKVQNFAVGILSQRQDLKSKQALLSYNPWLLLATWKNWKFENFDPNEGINPGSIALNIKEKDFNSFLSYPESRNIESLICYLQDCDYSSKNFVDIFSSAQNQLTSLKAAYIGVPSEPENISHSVYLSDFSQILKSYPNLEVLQVRGSRGLLFSKVKHENLRTLILETRHFVDESIGYLNDLELPALEYLDLWLGNNDYADKNTIKVLTPILSGKLFPKLKYLGLRSNKFGINLANALVESPILKGLKVIDISHGNLGDEGAEILINSPGINQLHTLNLCMNGISPRKLQRIWKLLNCRVIGKPQK